MSRELVERLSDEADLCRNEGAHDMAALLDEARAALSAQGAVAYLVNYRTAIGTRQTRLQGDLSGFRPEDDAVFTPLYTHPAPVSAPTAGEDAYKCPNCGEDTDLLGSLGNHCHPSDPVSAPTAEAEEAAHLCVALVGPGCVGCVNYKAGMEAGREYERALRKPQVTEEARLALALVDAERELAKRHAEYEPYDAPGLIGREAEKRQRLWNRWKNAERKRDFALTAAINGKGE